MMWVAVVTHVPEGRANITSEVGTPVGADGEIDQGERGEERGRGLDKSSTESTSRVFMHRGLSAAAAAAVSLHHTVVSLHHHTPVGSAAAACGSWPA